jgi:hypothetical protein
MRGVYLCTAVYLCNHISAMQKIITILCLIITNITIAQNVEIISKSDFKLKARIGTFAFIEQKTDTAKLLYVATFKVAAEDNKTTISEMLFKIKMQAHLLGANCFRLNNFNRDSLNRLTIVLDTYYGNDSIQLKNFNNHEKNTVFIFCNDRLNDEKYLLKVNKEKKEFRSGTYLTYHLKEGEDLKITKGGFTGATFWIKYEENKQPVFLTITGFGLGGGPIPAGTIGMSFNTGRINYIDENLGHLLTLILKPGE